MNHIRNEMKLDAMDMSETYQAAASIQLRTHPSHSTINFSELGKKLLEAARNGDTEDVKELINTGAPFTTDWLGASPLHYASQYGHVDTAEALLRAGIAKDARTKIDRTALHVASQEGHINTVSVLVQYGADVDSKDMLKMTPLHWAVQRGHRDVMEILLEHGADVNIVNKFEKSPIDIAYTCGYHDFVPLLQNYKGRVKPKVNPIETTIPAKVLKNNNLKSRPNKSQNINRNSFSNKVPLSIKQEIDDELDQDDDIKSLDLLESMGKQSNNNKKDKDNMLQNVISNGQTISLTEAGKLVLNTYNKDQQQNTSNKKLITLYPQSNILLVSNNQSGAKSNDATSANNPIKVIPKKPMFTEIKNTKSIPVDKLPFFNAKSGTNQVIKRYVINTNQQNLVQAKDEEIKKLQEEIKNLKRELEDYKGLIISKDLEIEKIKKRKDMDK